MPPESGGKWGTECFNTRFPLPTLLCHSQLYERDNPLVSVDVAVAGVAHAVGVGVVLRGVAHARAVVAEVADPVRVHVLLLRVVHARTVVALVQDT